MVVLVSTDCGGGGDIAFESRESNDDYIKWW